MIDWDNPENARILAEVERAHPLAKPRNQRRIASRIVRGVPPKKRAKKSAPSFAGLPDSTLNFWQ